MFVVRRLSRKSVDIIHSGETLHFFIFCAREQELSFVRTKHLRVLINYISTCTITTVRNDDDDENDKHELYSQRWRSDFHSMVKKEETPSEKMNRWCFFLADTREKSAYKLSSEFALAFSII